MPQYDVIKVEPHEQVVLTVVQPTRLDNATAIQLENEVSHAALAVPGLPLVIDMSNVKFAPSVALGALVNLAKGMKMSNRKLFVVGANRQIRGTLAVTRLDVLIAIRNSIEDVLAE